MKLETVAIDLIDVGTRVRPIRRAAVEGIARDLDARGPRQPIELRRKADGRFDLISGLQRLEAHRVNGRAEIIALVYPKGWSANARLRDEVMENLARAELTKLERAQHLAVLRGVYHTDNPDARRGVAGGKARQGSAPAILAFADWAAERIDMSARTVERYAAIGDLLDGDAADSLRGTEFEDKLNELDALARLAPDKQRRVVALLTRDEDAAASVAEALAQMEGRVEPAPSPEQRLFAGIMDRWRRAPATVRRAFAEKLDDTEIEEIAAARGYALIAREEAA